MPTGTRAAIMTIREHLGRPASNAPNNNTILTQMNLEVNTLWSELRITRDNEAFKRIEQQLDPGVSDYTISRDDFGQAFMVETWDYGADPYFIPVELTIAPIQSRDRQMAGLQRAAVPYIDPVFSFYTEDQRQKFTVTPPVYTPCAVRIYYEVESYVLAYNDMPLPLRDQFVHLMTVRTALAKLPDTDLVGEKYQQRYMALKEQEARLMALFQDQKFSQQTDDNARGSFGWERDYDGWPFAL